MKITIKLLIITSYSFAAHGMYQKSNRPRPTIGDYISQKNTKHAIDKKQARQIKLITCWNGQKNQISCPRNFTIKPSATYVPPIWPHNKREIL
jgi:hypothetical protein